MPSYNLFCLKGVAGLCCAVPETAAVPRFVGGGRWTYRGRCDDDAPPLSAFDGRAAATAVRFNGFYLFQSLDRRLN